MAPNKMLIDATHPEETRVVVLRNGRGAGSCVGVGFLAGDESLVWWELMSSASWGEV